MGSHVHLAVPHARKRAVARRAGSEARQALLRVGGKQVAMNAEEVLRETERLLAIQYGAKGPPKDLDGDELDCDDLADVEHWVKVYTELVDFTRGLLATSSSSGSNRDSSNQRALMLQARIQELHLAYWVDRLSRLRAECGGPGTRPR